MPAIYRLADFRPSRPEIVDRLANRALALARDILPKGVRHGAEWCVAGANSPFGCSVSVHLTGSKAGVWGAWAAGKGGDALDLITATKCDGDWRAAIGWAQEWLRIESPQRTPQHATLPAGEKSRQVEPSAEEKRNAAFRLWLAAAPLQPNDPVWLYLEARGIDLSALPRVPGALRYFSALTNTEAGPASRRCWPPLSIAAANF